MEYFFHSFDVNKKYELRPGNMTEEHFLLLSEVSSIHSEKVISALKDFLVFGYTRKEACIRNNVAQSYFSGALERFQRMNSKLFHLMPYYPR